MSDQILRCPHDHATLALEGYWKHPRHRCDTCGGYALAERDLLDMLGRRDRPRREADAVGAASTLVCPRDKQALRPRVRDEVAFDLCKSCGLAWVSREEYQKLTGRKAAFDAERLERTDYVAEMAPRIRIAMFVAMPLVIVGFFGGLLGIIASGGDGGRYPLAMGLLFCCFAGGGILLAKFWRCPRCEQWLATDPDSDGESGFDLSATKCRHCGARLR